MQQLTDEERREILAGLKANWEQIHHEYQVITNWGNCEKSAGVIYYFLYYHVLIRKSLKPLTIAGAVGCDGYCTKEEQEGEDGITNETTRKRHWDYWETQNNIYC